MRLIAAVASFWLLVAPAAAQQTDLAALRGLKGVALTARVNGLDPGSTGLASEQIRIDAMAQLEKAGIPAGLDPTPPAPRRGKRLAPAPTLAVIVAVTRNETSGLYHYAVEVQLRTPVRLLRKPPADTVAITWQNRPLVIGETNDLEFVRDAVGNEINKFVKDYATANTR